MANILSAALDKAQGRTQDNTPYIPSEIEKEAIRLVDSERIAWETSTAFVTNKVAFDMKNLIRQCRKNWWGIFDEPIDPTTGHKKIFVPLTESVGETVVKNIDLDTKDVTFRAKKPSSARLTALVRSIVRNYLDKMSFGEKLDELETILARDGTCVWKTLEVKEDDEYCTRIFIVDLLNAYLDPTSPSIQEAYRFTERGVLYPSEIEDMDGWLNTKNLKASVALPRNDNYTSNPGSFLSSVKGVDVWESYGKYPKFLITGKTEDKKIEEDIHIVVSGLEAGERRVHLIETYSGKKPYEEAWYAKVPGRWYGKGVAEKLMTLQLWLNTIVNIRVTRSRVSQLGLFTIRRGSGITPQQMSRLAANGAITVNTQDDIKQLVMQEASQASFNDENNIYTWSQRVTSAFESVTGEQLPSSTSATQSALQTHSAQSQFVLVKEQIGMFLQRWLWRHAIPTIFKNIKNGDIIQMSMEDEELKAWDEALVNAALYEELEKRDKEGIFLNPEEVLAVQQQMLSRMINAGKERFVQLLEDIDWMSYEVAIDITNESVDKGVIATNLLQALSAAPEYRESILPQLFDTMGLTFKAPTQPPMPLGQNGLPAGQGASPETPPTQNPVMALGRANTLATKGITAG